jgi:hypothetical protein
MDEPNNPTQTVRSKTPLLLHPHLTKNSKFLISIPPPSLIKNSPA